MFKQPAYQPAWGGSVPDASRARVPRGARRGRVPARSDTRWQWPPHRQAGSGSARVTGAPMAIVPSGRRWPGRSARAASSNRCKSWRAAEACLSCDARSVVPSSRF